VQEIPMNAAKVATGQIRISGLTALHAQDQQSEAAGQDPKERGFGHCNTTNTIESDFIDKNPVARAAILQIYRQSAPRPISVEE
jgi:hypothetical protein